MAACATSVLLTAPAAFAQAAAYPGKTISMIVSYPPGGDTDAIARMFGDKLSKRLKETVVIDNRPGAGGTVGNSFVSRAAPDGYTLLFTPNPFTTAPLVMKLSPGSSYDVLHGFEPIINTATQPMILVAHPSLGVKTLPDLITAAKGGKMVTYASPGAGSPMHIIGEWLNRAAGVKFTHVPYKGVGPSVTDVVAGHVNTAWVTIGAVRAYMDDGRLIPLAIGDAQRTKLAPNVPTLVELGYKDVVVGTWNGFFAPKGTPAPVVKLLNGQLNEILKQPDVAEKLGVFGALPAGGTPEKLGQINANEYETMGKVIKELGISLE
jgi:tripartite-type tricarboxylate transporter receptor subunit TctC